MTATATPASYRIQDETVTLPVEIRLARTDFAAFWVPAGPVQDLIGESGLTVAEPMPGRAVLTLLCAKYLDGDLGPYNEAGIAVMVRPHDAPKVSAIGNVAGFWRGQARAYIHELPVNQSFTLEAGREIWGFPKWMAAIDITTSRRGTRCILEEGGRHIWTLDIRRGMGGFEAKGQEMQTYCMRDGTVRSVPWITDNEGVRFRPGGAKLRLGDHPLAVTLAGLGLPRRAAFTGGIDVFRASWGAATAVDRVLPDA